MTSEQKKFLHHLLRGCYMVPSVDAKGREMWRLYEAGKKASPVMAIKYRKMPVPMVIFKQTAGGDGEEEEEDQPKLEPIELFKKTGIQYRLRIRAVQQLHGNNIIKKVYKKLRNEKNCLPGGEATAGSQEAGAGSAAQACHPCVIEPLLQGGKRPGGTDNLRPGCNYTLPL